MIVRRFYQRFVQEFGSLTCNEMQMLMFGRIFDLAVPGEKEEWDAAGGMERCGQIVARTARLAAEAIYELPRR